MPQTKEQLPCTKVAERLNSQPIQEKQPAEQVGRKAKNVGEDKG